MNILCRCQGAGQGAGNKDSGTAAEKVKGGERGKKVKDRIGQVNREHTREGRTRREGEGVGEQKAHTRQGERERVR